jgi:hypothetical protein
MGTHDEFVNEIMRRLKQPICPECGRPRVESVLDWQLRCSQATARRAEIAYLNRLAAIPSICAPGGHRVLPLPRSARRRFRVLLWQCTRPRRWWASVPGLRRYSDG